MSREWFNAGELAGLPGLPGTDRGIRKIAKRNAWRFRKRPKGKGLEYHITSLPSGAQAALLVRQSGAFSHSENNTPDGPAATRPRGRSPASEKQGPAPASYSSESLWRQFEAQPQRAKDVAAERLAAVQAALQLIEQGTPARDAWRSAGRDAGVGRSTVQRWYAQCRDYERADWLAALAPRYGKAVQRAGISTEAWDYFRADYLRPEQSSIAACYDRMLAAAESHGWDVPSRRTVERRVGEIPLPERVLMREGEHALMRLYPPMQRSVADLHALEWINGDGYQHNVFVRFPDGTVARPKTWVWQDVYSRRILAWRTDQTEHTDVIRQSVGDLIETYGIPHHATIDNTRAAANKWLSGGVPHRYRFRVREEDPHGLFKTLDIAVHWTSIHHGKGHGQAKPVERAFGVGGLGEFVDRHPALAGAYTGASVDAKPDNYGARAVDLAEFLEVLAQGIRAWNARKGRKTEICAGRLSFDDAFAASYATAPVRKATAEQRRLWMLSAEAQRVDRQGRIKLDAGGALGLGRNYYFCDALAEHAGGKVVARFDPERLHESVHVYTLDNRYIGEAECTVTAGFGDSEAGRRYNRARREWVRARKAAAAAQQRMTAEEAARLLPESAEPDLPETNVVRPEFGRAAGQDFDDIDEAAYDEKFARAIRAHPRDDWPG